MVAISAGFLAALALALPSSASAASRQRRQANGTTLVNDIDWISQHWGQISPYRDNVDDIFGVQDVGLPNGCQIEQVQTLQRHSQRFPTSYFDDGVQTEATTTKILDFTTANPNSSFSGPLAFLNSYRYQLGESYLTGLGANTEFQSGVSFWNRYGRTLYNASVGQVQYNASYVNGSLREKPVLRTTSQSRIENSQISWSLGFFGPSFYKNADPTLGPFVNGSLFDVVIIPEGGTENNTLAAYDSCFADFIPEIGDLGDRDLLFQYVPMYLQAATARLQQNSPLPLTVNDTYAMQLLCAYETAYIQSSDFCGLFTEDEWAGFENTLDIAYYYDYGYGNPTGRAQGLGYLQEVLARLTKQYITSSNSSVNSSLTDNAKTFPLGRPFYADFSHDDIIVSALAAANIDYFREHPSLTQYPPDPNRHFNLNKITPFGARLITELIGCSEAEPAAVHNHRTQYTPDQYGYDASNAPHKFVRIRVNNGIVPLDTIRGGKCEGRTDGLCALEDFVASQANAENLANYDFACFGNYTLVNPTNGNDYDGTVTNSTPGVIVSPGRLTAEYIESL